jgi:hypothetical protein
MKKDFSWQHSAQNYINRKTKSTIYFSKKYKKLL